MRIELLLAIVGCGQPSARDPSCADTFYADVDGDGHGDALATVTDCSAPSGYATTSDDCDDDNATIHPGADEICNDVDDDCDLAVDEDAIDARVWYTDADGDGFGDDAAVTTACTAASDQVAVAGDCADGDAAVNPDADELCNDVDDDCDGLVDSEDSSLVEGTVWYTDADGDGYGDPATGAHACEDPAGRTTDSADCDDTHSGVHPNAEEICNGTDHDCDALVCVQIDLSTADAKLVGEEKGDGAGDCISGAGDVDGDGRDDMLVGTTANAAYLVLGPVTGIFLDLSWAEAKLVGTYTSVSGAGDVDLLLGAFADDEAAEAAGAAYLVLGPVTGTFDLSAGADAKLLGEQESDWAGESVSGAGDVDGDGRADMLVGARNNGEGGSGAGAAYLVLGPVTGTLDLSLADAKLVGEDGLDEAAYRVSGAGDVDGDGHDDLLVGARFNSEGARKAGAGYLVLGPVTGTRDLSLADAKFLGVEPWTETAHVAGAGDVDGDGHDDVLVGAGNQGVVYLVLGAVTGTLDLSFADARLEGEGPDPHGYAGYSVSGAGDVDADGRDDMLVGAYGDSEGGYFAGAAYVVLGPATGTVDLSVADAKLVGEAAYDYAGASVAGVGDVDDDGRDDVLVGAYYNAAGAAYLLYGAGL